jgi:hypothetical protein
MAKFLGILEGQKGNAPVGFNHEHNDQRTGKGYDKRQVESGDDIGGTERIAEDADGRYGQETHRAAGSQGNPDFAS